MGYKGDWIQYGTASACTCMYISTQNKINAEHKHPDTNKHRMHVE